MIVGIEGTSLTGKTTLALALKEQLENVVVIPDYYEMTVHRPYRPPLEPTGLEAQLDALSYYLDLEAERCRMISELNSKGAIILLDRTIDTLLAHTSAIGITHGFDAAAELAAVLKEAEFVTPDLTVHLVVHPGELRRRAESRPGFPEILYRPDFVSVFDNYFSNSLAKVCCTINGEMSPSIVAHSAQSLIRGVR